MSSYVPSSWARVPAHTRDRYNRRIRQEMEASVAYYAEHPEEIEQRLWQLDREWDTERTLEANAATLALTGTVLGATVDRRFLALPGVVTAFLLQHAVQGWCPPLPMLRRMGFRTPREIERERTALKALRGDFAHLDAGVAEGFSPGAPGTSPDARNRARAALAAADSA